METDTGLLGTSEDNEAVAPRGRAMRVAAALRAKGGTSSRNLETLLRSSSSKANLSASPLRDCWR